MELSFFAAPENLAFGVSLGLVFLIGTLEGLGMLLGVTLSGMVDDFFPDLDFDADVDVDADIDVDVAADIDGDVSQFTEVGFLTKVLGWMRFGQVPVLVLFIIFLTSFGLGGYVLQMAAARFLGEMLSLPAASLIAFFSSLPVVRISVGAIAPFIPKDETSAVSKEFFLGKIALISSGNAKRGLPAQAKIKDEYGRTHYIQVEPEDEEAVYSQGDEVEIIERSKATFICKLRH